MKAKNNPKNAKTKSLAMFLDGPMQTWKHGAPTKKDIVKIISGAMGIAETSVTQLPKITALDMKIHTLATEQSKSFGAVVTGEEQLLSHINNALQNPRSGIFLGDESCIPTAPVSQGLHDSEKDAVSAICLAFEKTHGKKCEIAKSDNCEEEVGLRQ